jgi:hypothetical protein
MKTPFLAALLTAWTICAIADTIVDTGAGTADFGYGLDSSQSLAAEFSIGLSYAITNVQADMQFDEGGTLNVSLYADNAVGSDVPGTLLQTGSLTILNQQRFWSWVGPDNLSWSVDAGTYWIGFSGVGTPTPFIFGMIRGQAPFPLGNEAVKHPGENWIGGDQDNLGIRIYGSPIPEPSPLALLAAGAAAMIVSRETSSLNKKLLFEEIKL